jgi:hypothetical protein
MSTGVAGSDPAPGAINIFTCTPSAVKWWVQRFRFWTTRRSQWVARHLSNREAGDFTLKRLDILHTAVWLRLGRFPAVPGSRREDRRYVLFCSNFSGEWDPYRQAFLDVVGHGIRTIWGVSLGFPRGFPGRGSRYAVEEWVQSRLPPTAHYYRAYPDISPSEVRGAVRLARELESFARNAAAGRYQPDRSGLLTVFRQLQGRIADELGATPPAIVAGASFGPPVATGMSNLVSAMPILPGREDDVLARICRLPPGLASPFREVEGTHFARLVVLDRRTASHHRQAPIVLHNSWLVLAVDFDGFFGVYEAKARRMADGEVTRYLTALDRSALLRSVWQDCVGFRRDRTLAELLRPSVIDRYVLFLDHGDTTLREIDRALRVKHDYLARLEAGALADLAGVEAYLAAMRARL